MDSEGISIIICTYNGSLKLTSTLFSILNQQTIFPMELIIVDNNSNDKTSEFVENYLKNQKISWKIVNEVKPGLSFARWKGINESRYDVILFCDDDNDLFSNYLELGMNYILKNPCLGILGGMGIPKSMIPLPQWFDKYSSSYAVGSLGKSSGKQPFGSYHYGAACFFRRKSLLDLKNHGFEGFLLGRSGSKLTSGEDIELFFGIQLLGFELHFLEDLKFYHILEADRLSWSYFLKLKAGIASSFPLIESYQIHAYVSYSEFRKKLLIKFVNVFKGVIKCGFLRFVNPSKENEVELAVVTSKFHAFFRNYSFALNIYKRNKMIFGD